MQLSWEFPAENSRNPVGLWAYPFTALGKALTSGPWAYDLTKSTGTAVLALMNQSFQGWRIYMFTKNKIFAAFLVVGALAACGMGAAAAIQALLLVQCVCPAPS